MSTRQQGSQTHSNQGKRVAPTFATRYYRWMVTWAVFVAVACVSMAVFDWPRGLTIGSVTVEDWSATLLLATFAALWIVLVVRWEKRLSARLRAGDYCLCPNCGYAMTGHTGETACPECGRACDIEDAQRQWREYRPPPRIRNSHRIHGLIMDMIRNLALRRLLAFLVDYGVIVLFVAVVSAAGFAIRSQLGVTASTPTEFQQKLLTHALIFATIMLPILFYFAVSESSRWQATIGKRVLRLQVSDDHGGRRPLRRTLLRIAVKFLPWELAHTGVRYVPGTPFVSEPGAFSFGLWILALLLALWWFASIWLGDGRTPYDRIAGTVVTRVS